MSETKDCSNEEIVNEITKTLDSTDIKNSTEVKDSTEYPEEVLVEDSNDAEEDNDKDEIDKDDVNEEELKELESQMNPEEKENKRQESIKLKNDGNTEFKNGNLEESHKIYTDALKCCPPSFSKERSILYSNRAACKIKLGRNLAAIEDCTKAIELDPTFVRPYLRRAKLYEDTDKLDDSFADYKKILEIDPGIGEAKAACVRLPPLIEKRNEAMKEEMLGKLKELGNMVLKPFGLSTNNFNLQQDPSTGGYSINFSQNK